MSKNAARVSVICPLYNAEKEIVDFNAAIRTQKNVEVVEILYVVTAGTDNTEKVLKANDIPAKFIRKEEFSHSLTREERAFSAKGDILVFLTQDVVIYDDEFLSKLVRPIVAGEAEAAYARQRTKYNNIEKYTREFNYPAKSFVVSAADIPERGLKTFFFSDAASAILRSKFVELKGYDGLDLPTNEDMYFAHKLIKNGGRIAYAAEAEVFHSHKLKLRELYKRYYDTGKFFAMVPEIAEYSATSAGGGMAKYVLKRALREFNLPVLLRFSPDMMARYFGMRKGKKYKPNKEGK